MSVPSPSLSGMTTPHPAAAHLDQLAAIADSSRGLADAAEGNLGAPIEHCPGWSVADLVAHLTDVQWFWATIAAGPLVEPPSHEDRPARVTDEELVSTLRAGADRLVTVLAAADPAAPAWTWAPAAQTVGFIRRHQVQEAAVHHWDAVHAAGGTLALDPAVAVDAIEEFLTYSVSSPTDPAEPSRPPLAGQLMLRASDVDAVWTVTDADPPGTVQFHRGSGDGAPAVSGSAADLLLWLYQRVELGLDDGTRPLVQRLRALSYTD